MGNAIRGNGIERPGRELADEDWAQVAASIMDRTGLAPDGDDDGVRWVAVRHAPDHIHLVATLARQDGTRPRIWNDFYRVREACRDAERRLGLAGTAPADRTAARRPAMYAPVAVPTGTWLCIEWQHDGGNDVTHFWWDAVPHPSLDTTKTMHGGNTNPFTLDPFTAVWFGWQEYQTSTEPFELWIDELAVDTTRIGCVM